jgi:8-oxo-dGTP diphosphatase
VTDDDLVRAAGGLLLRPGSGGALEVALVHRPKYDDWSFPKGKLVAGETFEEAALREVEEETGYRARLDREIPGTRYRDAVGRPKVVRYWTMTPVDGAFRPNSEVDELRWVRVDEAARALSYDHDRSLLRALPEAPEPP